MKYVITDAPEMTEDCLTVTLYIPATKDPNETYTNMSLVVHIHGGIFSKLPKETAKLIN